MTATSQKMYAFTAPSGAGKTTVVRHLLKKYNWLDFSISATTRAQRPHEQHGVDYYFLSQEAFKDAIEKGAFIEYEEVYENQYYGTLYSEVDRVAAAGKYIVFDIEVKGATNLKKTYGDDCLVTFISPPSLEILVERLRSRQTESEESLRKRIARVEWEMTFKNHFDTILINDLLEVTLHDAEAIVENFLYERFMEQ